MPPYRFFTLVSRIVSKTSGRPLREVDSDFDVLAFYDPGAEAGEQAAAAAICANEILFEAGYPVGESPSPISGVTSLSVAYPCH